MTQPDYHRLSFQATIGFALMALFLLGQAGFALGDPAILFHGLAVAGLSYVAQWIYTLVSVGAVKSPWGLRLLWVGGAFQLLAVVLFVRGAFLILRFA
mgnify:CR=1 FL=1